MRPGPARRTRAVGPAALILLAAALATAGIRAEPPAGIPGDPAAGGAVRIGFEDLFVLTEPHGSVSARERADLANRKLAQAARDPGLGPEQVVLEPAGDVVILKAGPHAIVEVTPADALAARSTPETLAAHWAARIRAALETHKRETFSLLLAGRWIRRLIYPTAILVLLWAGLRLLDRLREHASQTPVERYPALHVLGLAAVSAIQMKTLALRGVRLARWLAGLAAVYTLLAVVFAQFPHTRAYALRMLTFVTDLLVATLENILQWLPPLIAALVVLLAVRLGLRLTGILFARARRGQADLPVAFAPDTIALSEAIVRIAIALAGVALLALVIPGEGGRAMRMVLLLLLVVVAATLVPAGRQIAAGVLLAYRRAAPVGTRLEVDGIRGTVTRHELLHTIVVIEGGQEAWIPNDLLMRHRSIRPVAPVRDDSRGPDPGEDDRPA